MIDILSDVAGNFTELEDLGTVAAAEEEVALAGGTDTEDKASTKTWFLNSSSASTDIMVLKPFWVFTALFSFFFQAPFETVFIPYLQHHHPQICHQPFASYRQLLSILQGSSYPHLTSAMRLAHPFCPPRKP
jgi:hypothetical protein